MLSETKRNTYSRTPLTIACAIGVLATGLLSTPAASAATTIGATAADPSATCAAGDNLVQGASASPSYAVPTGGGVITSWAHAGRASTSAGQGKLIVWRPSGDASKFTVVGKSSSQSFTPSTKVSYTTRISVMAGDVLGMRIESSGVACWISNQITGMRKYNGADPADGSLQTFGVEQTTQNVNVEATLEPDADGDGYGDETQDACVGVAGPGPCPADPDPDPTEPDPDPEPEEDLPGTGESRRS